MPEICVLRLGHRVARDQRITTHVFLVARALGATCGVLCGDEDESVLSGVGKVTEQWGGNFKIRYEKNWRGFVREKKRAGWVVVHLTMYGEGLERGIGDVVQKNCLIIVGAGKVPKEAYELADLNAAVTNQPHSEIAALAIFLDRMHGGRELGAKFGGRMEIIPNKCGKIVVRGKNRCRDI